MIDWSEMGGDIKRHAAAQDRSIRQVGRHIGVSSPTMSRAANGKAVEVDAYLRIVRWLGYSPYLYWRDQT